MSSIWSCNKPGGIRCCASHKHRQAVNRNWENLRGGGGSYEWWPQSLIGYQCDEVFATKVRFIGFYRLQKPIKQVLVRISHQFIGFIGFIGCSNHPGMSDRKTE